MHGRVDVGADVQHGFDALSVDSLHGKPLGPLYDGCGVRGPAGREGVPGLREIDQGAVHTDLLSIGEVLLDFIAPEADDLAAATDFVRLPGGAPANVAVAVSRLGG